MNKAQYKIKSPLGSLYLVASTRGLQGIFFEKQSVPFARDLKTSAPEVKILRQSVVELGEYFTGQRQNFTLPLDLQGTAFQKRVWNQLSKIPYGETRSYKDIAIKIKNAKATRAVGTANGKNPVCIIVPCHRVIAADGTLGGYSGGLEKKRKLLGIERVVTRG